MQLLTVESLLSLAGMSAFVALVVQLLKVYLKEWRFTNLLALGISLVVGLFATWTVKGLSPKTVLDAILLALVAGAASSGISETVSNLRGLAGAGPRSDEAQLVQAVRLVDDAEPAEIEAIAHTPA